MGYNVGGLIDSVVRSVTNAVGNFARVISFSETVTHTVEGGRFNQEFDTVFITGETKYFLYYLPPEAVVTVGLQNRIFKSKDGEAELEILWNSTGYTEGTLETVFNEYNKYQNGNEFRVSEITAPTDQGIIRETDFLTGSGQGVNSSGDVSSELGYRLYEPGTFFIAKVTNTHNANNRVILSYSWVELPAGELTP